MKLLLLLLALLPATFLGAQEEELNTPKDAIEDIAPHQESDIYVEDLKKPDNGSKEDISMEVILNQAPKSKSRLGKNTILNLSGSGAKQIDVILVDKALRSMYIARLDGENIEVIKEFKVLTGEVEGNKIKQGDKKTPEGIYYVLSHSTGEELIARYGKYAEIYGAGSFPLNYPNKVDRIHRKTGGGIWLHGVKPNLDKTFTQGCVALNNANFLDMAENVKINTPVIIAENLLYSDSGNYSANRNELSQILSSFINAWKNNDKAAFKNLIHSDFRYGASAKEKYLTTKLALMDRFPNKDIINSNVRIYQKDKDYIVFDTDQFYCAPNLSVMTNKKYYFLRENGTMKLLDEEVSQKSIQSNAFVNKTVEDFLSKWVAAWQSKNINDYISFYDKDYRGKDGKGKRETFDQYKARKASLFTTSNDIKVRVSNVEWSVVGGEYRVSFIQEYSAGEMQDRGRKTLTLSGCPSFFKITNEVWSKL